MVQIKREGSVVFNDASLSVWEEGLGGLSFKDRDEWEKSFKHQVFKRIIQTLNRTGWKCVVPPEMIERHRDCKGFAELFRYCIKGDLKADLSISGRHIELKMFQNINAPDRPDHEGRYQSDKEKHMPYIMRLEMKRTRNKIRDYLCNVFTDYKFKTDRFDGRMNKRGPDNLTSLEWIEGCYETSWHFKGDINKYKIEDYNRKSGDNLPIHHKQRVWFSDYDGRICTGIAYYNINNMWWIITGKYDVRNISSGSIFVNQPKDIRKKRNDKLRKRRLEDLMDEAVKELKFERAAELRDILLN
jgi:hypothetical protein